MNSRNLVVRAGTRAALRLQSEGFHPELFDTLAGASGGPKWLVLRHLDEVLINRLIEPRSTPLDTLGSSIGSFRHACFAQSDINGGASFSQEVQYGAGLNVSWQPRIARNVVLSFDAEGGGVKSEALYHVGVAAVFYFGETRSLRQKIREDW